MIANQEPKSLMTLVALASTLFDQQAALEKNQQLLEEEKEAKRRNDLAQNHKQQQQSPSLPKPFEPQPKLHLGIQREKTSPVVAPKPMAAKIIPSAIRNNNIAPKKNTIVSQTSNFQCCTREGFLSKLFSVLDDESLSHVLAWMPDGKSFTIVSSREFSKSGMVYDLFGIKKMSSFLRRLNQLGFARVRDPTDPSNLDVFRKPGFVKVTAETTTKTAHQRLDSPTSTLQFSPTITATADKSQEIIPKYSKLPSSGSSFVSMSPKPSTPVDFSTTIPTTERQVQTRTTSTDSDNNEASWVYSTPETVEVSQTQSTGVGHLTSTMSDKSGNLSKNHFPLASMPPSIPAFPSGGPVLLRARSESYERPLPPLAKSLPPPPTLVGSSCHKTPTVKNNCPLELSPGTFQTLQIPRLEQSSRKPLSTTPEIRPPPIEFVAEFVRKLAADRPLESPMPMEVDERTNGQNQNIPPTSPCLGMAHIRAFPKLQQLRDYIRLCEAAENEANAILDGSLNQGRTENGSRDDAQASSNRLLPYEASVLAHIELLQGYKRRKSFEVSAE
eukprot:CAMPEP_0116142086 /NCGR_PEP_ID=MMETSP0329-20121206/14719_1 /TAXON_ID=697910 /ORGANISM="Pseudo-nitzschia arenysensis, Strain B593" /LENGTH=555 /DNA_ID=CAMNT_0003637295 /DNA_START=113 /DNA_END=1780 /DNA_ORIENTATION=+